MSVSSHEKVAGAVQTGSYDILAPFRVSVRLVGLIIWSLGCYLAMVCADLATLASPSRFGRVRNTISVSWLKGISRLVGTRMVIHGNPPRSPFFVVGNHISWLDFFAAYRMFDGARRSRKTPSGGCR